MKLFTGTANVNLSDSLAKVLDKPLNSLDIHVFPDGEKRVRVEEKVVDDQCVVVQPTSPPVDQNYMELFLIVDALKRSGAKCVTAVVSYLGYQRQDHVFRDGEAVSLDVVISTMEASGVDEFIIFDMHSIKIPQLFHRPVIQLSALPLFAEKIREITNNESLITNNVLVSPDMGGIRRIKLLSELLDNMPYAAIEKDRDLESGFVVSSEIDGDVKGKTAFIVDDMISSGGTIKAACNLLKEKGAGDIYVFATHPVFSEDAPEILQATKAEKIFVTNTIYIPTRKLFEKLEILSVANTIAKVLQ